MRIWSFVGLLLILGTCYLLSYNRKKIAWRTVISGVGLQLFFGLIILKTSPGRYFFDLAKEGATKVLSYTNFGSDFIFGPLASFPKVAEAFQGSGFVFATQILPTIIFTSALMSVLYHIGIMQKFVEWASMIMIKVMGTSGAESLASAANIFAGQTEAPLVVKPYINIMTKSELMSLMTGGMATVAGGVLAAYVGMGIDAGHLLSASVMSAPAALVLAKMLVPEEEESQTLGITKVKLPKSSVNLIDAASQGAGEGLRLAANVGAMLLAFIALIALANGMIGYFGYLCSEYLGLTGLNGLTIEKIMGVVFAIPSFFMGVPSEDIFKVGTLMGQKLVLNEFVAYQNLQGMMADMNPRSVKIATYALCGFANFSSIAIQVGGIGALAPKRRTDLAKLGIYSLIGGTFACMMTACVAGLFI